MIFLPICLALAALEIALRFFGPFLPGSYATNLYLEPHPIYGFFHVPNTTGWIRTPEFTARVDINSLGLREREFGYERLGNARRVLVLGDSFVEGAQVSVESLVTRQLEYLLAQAGGESYQVINGGVGAWGTAQEYLQLKTEGPLYHPDVVVVVFYTGNDVSNNGVRIKRNTGTLRKPYFDVGSDGSLKLLAYRPKAVPDESATDRLRRGSLLFGVFDSTVLRGAHVDDDDSAEEQLVRYELPVFSTRSNQAWDDAWRVTEGLLSALHDEAVASGVTFLLVNVPTKWEVYPQDWEGLRQQFGLNAEAWDLDGPSQRLAELTTRNEIPYVDLREPLAKAKGGERLYFQHDIHWTPAGHATAARAIAERLLRDGIN